MSIPIKTLTLPITSGGSTTETEYSFITPDDMDQKANVDGYYENLVSGGSEQLLSSVYEEDSEPYLFRTSGGSIDIGDREEDTIVGGTVAWNQEVGTGSSYFATNRSTAVWNGTKVVWTSTESGLFGGYILQSKRATVAGHKYYATALVNISDAGQVKLGFNDTPAQTITPNTNVVMGKIIPSVANNEAFVLYRYGNTDTTGQTLTADNIMLFDLTQMFGSTIADYIYSLEQANAGAGVAWFKKLFPNMDAEYSWTDAQEVIHTAKLRDYQSGILLSVEGLSEHVTVGFNQASEVSNGTSSTQYTRCLYAKAQLMPDTVYCISFVGAQGHKVCFSEDLFDTTATPWSTIVLTGARQSVLAKTKHELSTSNSAQYDDQGRGWALFKNGANNTVMPNFTDVCVNLSWDGERDGEYEPYVKHSYPLDDSLTLRGIPKLDSNNKLYYDGDIYEADGSVERRYGVITYDGSTDEPWRIRSAGSTIFYIENSGLKKGPNYSGEIICDKLKTTQSHGYMTDDYIITGYVDVNNQYPNQNWIYARANSSITELSAFKTWLQANPITLVYELATPTTEQAEPYQTPQIVDDFGTEEYVTDSIVPVGHVTKYMPNLKAKLEMAPDSPSDNGDYIVRHTNGRNEYVKLVIPNELPALPTGSDGTYVLKATVTNGTAVLSWEAE